MSRCFPFPPPGYDLKARPDDVNLIVKDKQKHKKHKEKKDKDKKEKERSVDKHKDDKKRKRKEHREKKDKNKDEQNGEKKNVGSLVNPVDGIHDKRAVVELANRVRSKDGATGNHMVQKFTVVEKENVNLLGKVLENSNGMLAANVRSLTIDSRSLGNGLFKVEGSPCQLETVEKRKEGRETNGHRNNANVRSLTIDSRSLGNGLFKVEGSPCQMETVEKRKEGRETNGHRNNANVRSLTIDSRSLGNGLFKVEGSPCQMETVEKRKEGRETNGHRNNANVRSLTIDSRSLGNGLFKVEGSPCQMEMVEKRKEGRETNGHRNNANVRSLTIDSRSLGNGLFKVEGSPCQIEMVEKRKEGSEMNRHRNNAVEGDGSKNEDKNNNMKAEDKNKEKTKKEMGFTKQESSDRSIRDFHSNQDCQGKLPKLKELNGFLYANGVRSDNMSRPVIASHQAGDEKVNAKRSSPQSVIDDVRSIGHDVKMAMQAPDVVHKIMHNKELRTKGEGHSKINSSSMLPSVSLKRKEKVATPMKPPHPDLKYLSTILTVPESVDLPPCDDQEWLFGPKGSQTKRPKLAYPKIKPTKQIWSEAVILENGTVALPYVIPY